jgi:Tol biopolymer transport system component
MRPLADVSPDGKRIVVTVAVPNQPTNVYMMNTDGTNRRPLTQFIDLDTSITALVWATDGIYYSIAGANNQDKTWRMDLDGANATEIADGTLQTIIGVG